MKELVIKGVFVYDVRMKRFDFLTQFPKVENFKDGVYKTQFFHFIFLKEGEIKCEIPEGFYDE